jgi:outer membrane protein OmpA-like peptidoglycan-associated protein
MRRAFFALVVTVYLASAAPGAFAQGAEGLDCERFRPALDSQGVILTEGGQGELSGELNVGLYLHYSRNPLVIYYRDSEDTKPLVSDRLASDFFVSMGMTDWLTLGVSVPAVFYQSGEMFDATTGSGMDLTSGALGDIRVVPKFTILREKSFPISLAVLVPFSLPSGDEGAYVGSNSVTFSPTVAASRHLVDDKLYLVANLGFWVQADDAQYRDLEADHEMFYRLGAAYMFTDDWWALGEMSGAARLSTMFKNKPRETPLEWILGIRYQGPYDLHFTLGGAVGSLPGWGTPNFRAFFSVLWAPREHDKDGDGIIDSQDRCPDDPGPRENGGCPWGDKDGDGLKDNEDKCPQKAGPPENQGCPWGDTDGDGLKDNEDKCPKDPGPKENNGCPWGDRDKDGIKDNQDGCPDEPGPRENGEDDDGCPDKDNDKDGIPDDKDKCPNEPETINGVKDDDGCPDKGRQVVIVRKEKIEILQKVHFAYGRARIKPDSYSLLNQVAQVLQGHQEIKKIRVEGHTDARGSDASNMRLSQRRANAVRTYLLKQGVDPARLKAVGYGESKPIAPNSSDVGREANRRVEFVILEKE